MNFVNLSLAYTAGALATLTPCALPMLPAYITLYTVSEEKRSLSSALKFGLTTVVGFLTVFTMISLIPSYFLRVLTSRITFIIPFMGLILILLGISYLFSDFYSKLPIISISTPRGYGIKAFYLFGFGYSLASLACSLPIFILMVFESSTIGDLSSIVLLFSAYGIGAATVIVSLSVAITYGQDQVYRHYSKILPYMKRINSLILIIAGIFMFYTGYQA